MSNKPDIYEPTAIIPKQSIVMSPQNSFQGVLIQQLKTADQKPVTLQTPVNVQQSIIRSSGLYSVSVQFLRNVTDANYSSTSVLVKTPNGISALQASGGNGPITFVAQKSNSPTSIVTQQTNVFGNSSDADKGAGRGVNL